MCKAGHYNLCPDVVFYATPPVQGAMSEYAIIRADFAHPLPDHVTYEQGALCEPISVGIHCCNLTGVKPGDTVVILGAGPIGLTAIVAARQRGAGTVIISDVYPKRLEVARRLGAIAVDVRTEDIADGRHGAHRRRGRGRPVRHVRRACGHRGGPRPDAQGRCHRDRGPARGRLA